MTTNIKLNQKSELQGNYVLLIADTLNLVLPLYEVGAVEYLDGVLEADDESGLLKLPGDEFSRRFAALSSTMTLLPHCPSDRFLVTTIGDENENLGWCWNELQVLIDVDLQPQPIPAVLLSPNTPVSHYVEFEGKFAYLCGAHQLCTYAFASRN
jgi:hypothetical protein